MQRSGIRRGGAEYIDFDESADPLFDQIVVPVVSGVTAVHCSELPEQDAARHGGTSSLS